MLDDLTGRTLDGRYEFEALLGEGTFARVYRITDHRRRATLAAKVLRHDIAADATFVERFRREADVLARLQHPNIVRTYGLVDLPEALFILVDYVPGHTLDTRLHVLRAPLRPAAALAYLTPLASALHFAHGEGVIHRDLKPGNVLLHENGTLLVTDFGIARLLNMASELTLGAPIGTPNYMAPEQITGDPVTPRTDIYSLGVMLYRMFAGRVPFRGDSPAAEGGTSTARIAFEHIHLPPPPPTRFNPELGSAVEEVVLRCLAKRADDRFTSVSALYDALTEAIGAPPVSLEDTVGPPASVPPDVQPPEWSQALPPVKDEDTPPLAQIQPIRLPVKRAATPPPHRDLSRAHIEHPAPPTEPHLERVILPDAADAAVTLPGMPRVRREPTPPPAAVYPPPAAFSPAWRAAPPPVRRRRRWLGAGVLAGLLVMLAGCVAALYLLGAFDQTPTPTPGSQASGPSGGSVGAPTQGTSAGGQRIAFDSARDGDLDLYIMNVDGGGFRQLTASAGAERGPAWSPDGSLLAFYGSALEEGNYDIYVMRPDGTGLRNLTQTPGVDERYPTWSPDGTRLAYHGNADGDYDLYIIGLEGGAPVALTENDVDDLGPDWSPEGTQIAYHSAQWGLPYELAVIDVETRQVRRLTDDDDTNAFPTWSPDGARLAFNRISAADGALNIYLLGLDGAPPQPLTTGPERSGFPDWSPDGQWIVYQRGEPQVSAIYRIPVAGGAPQALTGQQSNFLPDWEPYY